MEDYTYIWYYTRQEEEIYDPEKYRQLVEGLVRLNFYVALPGEAIEQKTLNTAGVSQVVQEDVKQAQSRDHVEWSLKAYSLDHSGPFDGFTFDLGNYASAGVLLIRFIERRFDLSPNGVALYEHFLQVIQLIYTIYHPFFAFQFDPRDSRSVPTREEALARQIRWLYDINLFGPELVDMLGRKKVESAPAQKVIPLDDGGIMLLPAIFFYPGFSQYSFKQVAAHLGLSYPY